MSDREKFEATERVIELCRKRGLKLATAESCTAGLLAAAITDVPGSSEVFDRGFITYSNEAKRELLGVSKELLDSHGAVSAEVAKEMAVGARAAAGVGLAVSVTGVAGPDGGTKEKPVGLVYIAASTVDGFHSRECRFGDLGRSEVRRRSVIAALALIEELLARPIPSAQTSS